MTLEEVEALLKPLKPQSGLEESLELFKQAEMLLPKVILEIGVADGGSLLLWSKLLQEDGLLIGIDAYSLMGWDLKTTKCKTVLIIGDSRGEQVVEETKKTLQGREIDFLRIDGGHDYVTAKSDFDKYSPFVREGGLIAFHDYNSSVEVKRYVDDLSATHNIVRIGATDSTYLFK